MSLGNVSTRTFVAVMVAFLAALIGRTSLQIELLENGTDRYFAADLSYLVVPPIMAVLLFPLWRSEKAFLATRFSWQDLTWKVVFRAVAIGVLLRLLWWGQIVAGGSFGFYRSDNPQAVVGPEFSFQCSSPLVVFLGFAVMAFMIPLFEEIVHRGFVVSFLQRRGQITAILISALAFMVFHRQGSWWFAFTAGLVFGYQYWHSHSLWPSLFSHMTFNGLIQIDWRCLSGAWNPPQAAIPLLFPGIASTIIILACIVGIVSLLAATSAGRV